MGIGRVPRVTAEDHVRILERLRIELVEDILRRGTFFKGAEKAEAQAWLIRAKARRAQVHRRIVTAMAVVSAAAAVVGLLFTAHILQ